MKHYELLYLISGSIPETELGTIQGDVNNLITKAGGVVTKHDLWGRRKLAYPIGTERNGFYIVAEFDAKTSEGETLQSIHDLEKKLRLHKMLLRHLLTVKPPLSEKELLLQEQAQKRAHMRTEKAEGDKTRNEKITVKKDASDADKKDSKISLQELDKKLDDLLKEDMI